MNYQHKNLSKSKWYRLDFRTQMANIGSEVYRTISWKNKGNKEYSRLAFERALELFDLTISDPKNINQLKEICRAREVLVDYFAANNQYKSSDTLWQNYFYAFNYAARVKKPTSQS